MQVHAITKNVRMSAQKMREVVRQIQGLPALEAQAILGVVPRKGARLVAKTLKSAIANAEDLKTHKKEYSAMKTDQLMIKEAVAQTAST
jgi:large subunit ribosomal protein L22